VQFRMMSEHERLLAHHYPAPTTRGATIGAVVAELGISDASRQLRTLAALSGSLTDRCHPSNVERVRAADMVQETIDIVSPIAEQKGVRIRFDRPAQPIELETDPLKLRQILVNLVTNAVKFTDRGDVTLMLPDSA
jgi:signal transduction histidine kinase